MADKTIGLFPAVVTPAGTDKILVEQGGVTKYETATQLLAAEVAARQSADTTLTNNLAAKAAVNSQVFTGTPSLPTGTTGVTQAANDSTTKLATTAFATTADLLRLRLSGADTMLGALNMGSNKINNLTDGTSNQDAVSLLQMNTGLDLKASILEAYDPTATGAYPTTWNGLAIKKGARYYISVAGTIGPATALAVQVGDELEALVNAAGNVHASWIIIQGNAVQATTTTAGILETATNAEALAMASTTVALTPSNLPSLVSSETFSGTIELATQAEVNAGVDDLRAVTPLKLKTNLATYGFWGLTGNSGTVDGVNFIGTADNVPLSFKVNGQNSGKITSTGSVYYGYKSGNIDTATTSTGIGYQSLLINTTGAHNVAVGLNTLPNNNGSYNVAIGSTVLTVNTTGNHNIGIGYNSLSATIGSTNCVGVGSYSGVTNTGGTGITCIGYGSDVGSASLTNATAIGQNAVVSTSNSIVLGASARVGIGTSSPATSAILDLTSTTGALLIPRMTTAQKNALTAVNGMLVYDSTLGKFQGYEAGVWTSLI